MNSLIYTRILDNRYELTLDNRCDEFIAIENATRVPALPYEQFVISIDDYGGWSAFDYFHDDDEDRMLECIGDGKIELMLGKIPGCENDQWEKLEIEGHENEVEHFIKSLFPFAQEIDIKDDMVTVYSDATTVIIEFDLYHMELVDYREDSYYDGPVYFELKNID